MAAAVAPLAAGTAHRGTVCHSPEYLMLSAMRGLHTDLFLNNGLLLCWATEVAGKPYQRVSTRQRQELTGDTDTVLSGCFAYTSPATSTLTPPSQYTSPPTSTSTPPSQAASPERTTSILTGIRTWSAASICYLDFNTTVTGGLEYFDTALTGDVDFFDSLKDFDTTLTGDLDFNITLTL
ncbi:unnamed protein product [Miscanthus lutarioriparius]|uniref:Uncharacterized protein n=1 Tax=Miscanthus lutarioriparius TaxID=422564 RepID=A0A811MG06_9POAL|nr:unnamed protein product [Miscanthus lutarioriparius]